MSADFSALENLFLGLADKTRLRLLGLMADGPVSVGHLVEETGESQPKISRHLAYLRNAGLVETTRDGKWIYYGIARLADASIDSVFRCVVDELSAAPSERPRPQKKRRPSALPSKVDNFPVEPTFTDPQGSNYVPDPYEEFAQDEEAEWTTRSEDRREELEVFLL